MEKLLKVEEVCDLLQVSRSLVYKWVHYDFVPYIKLGSSVRFKISALEEWIKKRERRGRPRIKINQSFLDCKTRSN